MKHLNLQDNDKEAKNLKAERLLESLENIQEIFHYQKLLYIFKIIYSKLISMHYDDLLISHFGIDKIWELIA